MIKNILIIITILLTSCSMQVSLTGGSVSPESKTVSVTPFDNFARIVNPILADEFTEALKSYMEQNTNLDLIQDNGDLHFEGKITGYSTSPISIASSNGGARATQNRFTLTVFISFTNKQTPKNNFEQSFSTYSDYDGDADLESVIDEFLEEVILKIVDDVYNKAIVNW